jgi:hypothetical protein
MTFLIHLIRSAAVVVPLLIEKCLSGRDKTKAKATQALLLYIEIESVEPVVVTYWFVSFIPTHVDWPFERVCP